MSVEVMVLPKIMIGVATKADAREVLADRALHMDTLRQAIEAVEALEPEQLKALVIHGLQDAHAYPLDFAEIAS